MTSDSERMAARHKRRTLSARLMASMSVLNALTRCGELVFAASIRGGLQARGSCLSDKGNQHIGDWLGCLGLRLPHHKQTIGGKTVVVYEIPLSGITRADLEAAFRTPDGWSWDSYPEFSSPCPPVDAPGCLHPHCPAGLPAGDAASDPVPGQPGDSIEAPASGGTPAVDGPDPGARPTKRKPRRRKRADSDLDLSDLDTLLGPTEEDLRRESALAAMLAQLADIP